MGNVSSFILNGVSIKTTVALACQLNVIDEHISRFMSQANDNKTKVFGFGTEWHLLDSEGPLCRRANVHLCDGSSCLIIQLSDHQNVPKSLVYFLNLPDYTFVGFGIKDNVAKLEKEYGFGITNAVELGPLAASVMKRPRLAYIGVDELAYVVNGFDLREERFLSLDFGFDNIEHRRERAKIATINVYSYHMIGTKLLSHDWE